jgi:hypothetical protein
MLQCGISTQANIGSKDLALQHVLNAENHLSGLTAGPGVDQLINMIGQARTLVAGSSGLTTTSSGPLLGGTAPLSGAPVK